MRVDRGKAAEARVHIDPDERRRQPPARVLTNGGARHAYFTGRVGYAYDVIDGSGRTYTTANGYRLQDSVRVAEYEFDNEIKIWCTYDGVEVRGPYAVDGEDEQW